MSHGSTRSTDSRPGILNAISVDVEDYFHASAFDRVVARASWDDYESRVVPNTHRLLDLFDEQRVHGTFFVLGWVARKFPELVKEIASRGHELASHGFHHQLVYMLTPAQFRDDIRRAKSTIEQAGGVRVRGYRAPSFSIVRASLWALDVLIEEGHTYDASIFPIHHDRYGIADAPRTAHLIQRSAGAIVELPGSTVRIGNTNYPIAGGGYFRLFPYAATKWGIARVNTRDGEPVVLYIHPWEVDPDQPKLEASRATQVRHHVGMNTTLDKLRQVTTDFSFGPIKDVLDGRAERAVPSTARWAHASSLRVSTATRGDAGAWEAYVEARGDAAGYHSWRWREVFAEAFDHEPVYLVARHGGVITGVLPMVQIKSLIFGRTLTSLPFVNYGGVMADAPEVGRALIEAAHQEARQRRCSHVELRHVEAQFPELPCKQHKVSMRLPLGPSMWDGLDRKVRNQIRKAEKSGLVVERGGAGLVGDFYTVFARNMRDLGTPVYSRRLFEEVLRAFPDRAQIHVVRLNGLPVAVGVTYRTASMVQLPWASSLRSYNTLCPNVLLYWDAIQFAHESGAGVFDMGRSTPNEGTFKFKAQWGAQPVPLHWEYQLLTPGELPNVSPANPKYQLAIALWQKLPLAVTMRVGPMIVRAIP